MRPSRLLRAASQTRGSRSSQQRQEGRSRTPFKSQTAPPTRLLSTMCCLEMCGFAGSFDVTTRLPPILSHLALLTPIICFHQKVNISLFHSHNRGNYSGQSNMAFLLENAFNGSALVKDADNYPHLRMFTSKKTNSNSYVKICIFFVLLHIYHSLVRLVRPLPACLSCAR